MVPELGTSVFIIPGARVKNGDERLVVPHSAWEKARIRDPCFWSASTSRSTHSGGGRGSN